MEARSSSSSLFALLMASRHIGASTSHRRRCAHTTSTLSSVFGSDRIHHKRQTIGSATSRSVPVFTQRPLRDRYFAESASTSALSSSLDRFVGSSVDLPHPHVILWRSLLLFSFACGH